MWVYIPIYNEKQTVQVTIQLTLCELEHGPVEIVGLPSLPIKNGDFPIFTH